MNVRPLHDRVLAKRIETSDEIRGGIFIPGTAKEKPQEAEVMAVGPGKYRADGKSDKRQPLDLEAGDRILISKYSGSEIKIDGEDYLILGEDDVLAVLEA